MKLEFNIGMQFILGYSDEVNRTGPVYPWQISSEIDFYLQKLLNAKITDGNPYKYEENAKRFNKLKILKKL